MIDNLKSGLLLHEKDIKLQRMYFKEMVKLQGIYVIYRYPLANKHYTTYAEIDSNFSQPILIGCIFDQHPNQQTTKKLGWISELQENSSVIHVDYDLPELQIGSLFIIPSGIDNSVGRIFKVTKLSNIMLYPASIACEIVPEYVNTVEQDTINDYTDTDFNILQDEVPNIFPVEELPPIFTTNKDI